MVVCFNWRPRTFAVDLGSYAVVLTVKATLKERGDGATVERSDWDGPIIT